MAVNPVTWPSFAEATLSDWAPVGALLCAIDERRAVADAVNGTSVTAVEDFGWADLGPGIAPTRAALERIRDEICALAAVFVLVDDDVYIANGYEGFPTRRTTYNGVNWFPPAAALPLLGEHSIADPPDPGSSELDPAVLERYRNWLSNCAWWLERLRYLDASPLCRWKRKATLAEVREYYKSRSQDPDTKETSEIVSGSPITGIADADCTIEEPEAGYPAADAVFSFIGGHFHEFHTVTNNLLAEWVERWREGIGYDPNGSHTAIECVYYTDLVAINPAALATDMLLVLCRWRVSPRTVLKNEIHSLSSSNDIRSMPMYDDGFGSDGWTAMSSTETIRLESFVAGEHRPVEVWERTVSKTGSTILDSRDSWRERTETTDYAPDASDSRTVLEAEQGTKSGGVVGLSWDEAIDAVGFLDSEYGDEPGIAPEWRKRVGPQSERVFEKPYGSACFRLPPHWDADRARSENLPGENPTGPTDPEFDFSRSFAVTRTLYLRVAPVFDYGPYFAYGRTP